MHEIYKNRLFLCYLPHNVDDYCSSCFFSSIKKNVNYCEWNFSDVQFGFIEGRGTNIAALLAEDVTNYCVSRGSPILLCSLDVERAFDGLPHVILF